MRDKTISRLVSAVKTLVVIAVLVRVLAMVPLLRAPIMDNVICDPDVGGAAYSAQFFFAPGSIYANAVETKPPGTYLLFNLLFRFFGHSMQPVSVFSIVYHMLCALALFLLGVRLGGLINGIVAAYLYTLYSAISAGNGLCYNFETWTLLPLVLAFYVLLVAFTRTVQPRILLFLGGALVATAVMFKQQAAMYVPAFGLALILETRMTPRNRKISSIPVALALYALGGLAVTALVFLFFATKGGLSPMLDALNPTHYLGYASTEGWGFLNLQIKESLLPLMFNARSLLLLAFLGLFSLRKDETEQSEERSKGPALFCAFVAATFLAVFAGTKFFDHYYMLLIPALSLLAARFVTRALGTKSCPLVLRITLLCLIVPASLNDMRLEIELGKQARENIVHHGRAAWTEESRFFWTKTTVPRYSSLSHRARSLAECIRKESNEGDTIYVWDYAPHIYFFSRRPSPTRHFMYFDVAVDLPRGSGRWHAAVNDRVLASREELLQDLKAKKPLYIVSYSERPLEGPWVHLTDHAAMFPELKSFVRESYETAPLCRDPYFVTLRRMDG